MHKAGSKFWSLGLVRVSGSMPARNCVEFPKTRLKAFGLGLSVDIVAICTDGATVMCRVGRLIEAEHQLCYAHGIQRALVDVLYKGKLRKTKTDKQYTRDIKLSFLEEKA